MTPLPWWDWEQWGVGKAGAFPEREGGREGGREGCCVGARPGTPSLSRQRCFGFVPVAPRPAPGGRPASGSAAADVAGALLRPRAPPGETFPSSQHIPICAGLGAGAKRGAGEAHTLPDPPLPVPAGRAEAGRIRRCGDPGGGSGLSCRKAPTLPPGFPAPAVWPGIRMGSERDQNAVRCAPLLTLSSVQSSSHWGIPYPTVRPHCASVSLLTLQWQWDTSGRVQCRGWHSCGHTGDDPTAVPRVLALLAAGVGRSVLVRSRERCPQG